MGDLLINGFVALTYSEFIENYHEGLTKPALHAAKLKGQIDVEKQGSQNFVLLTDKTMAYQPNKSQKRNKKLKHAST